MSSEPGNPASREAGQPEESARGAGGPDGARRGRLKLYVSFAAGVGTTYRMLEEARRLRRSGADVVAGLVECHGRPETAAMLDGLELIPLRRIEYRGVTVEELDVDALVRRKPQVTLVDDIAHTNAPGSRNRRRYLDVVELLGAGIDVVGALNIQHLESLNDLIERETGIVVRETVPDGFLRDADSVVILDLAVEDLLERLLAGKIYSAEDVPRALHGAFTPRNLATLRELALREAAMALERASERGRRATGEAPMPAGRVMVCLSSHPPRAAQLLRRGSRLAGRLNTDWYVVYVETPGEAPGRIDALAQRSLLDNIDRARELGAEVVRLEAGDPVPALVDFARTHGVRDVILGRSQRSWWRQALGLSVPLRMVKEAQGFDLHVVALDEDEVPR